MVLEYLGAAWPAELELMWRGRVERAKTRLGWPVDAAAPGPVARRHLGGASLAFPAPVDQLFTATEVNEWALCAALAERQPERREALGSVLAAAALEGPGPGSDAGPAVLDEAGALARFERLAAHEARPRLRALHDAGEAHGLQVLLDEQSLSLGTGEGGVTWPLEALPEATALGWATLRDVPVAVVTGSNGKTTTVRLIAACAAAAGLRTGVSCTDGLFVAGAEVGAGDYSGPAGARRILRDGRVQAAVLETARGGILRRGLALQRAHAAVVTNVSTDHFGEYGIHDLDALADVKLTVAQLVRHSGLLVLNADDELLRARSSGLARRYGSRPATGWFALDADAPPLLAHRAAGGATCGVRGGRLLLASSGAQHDLGAVADMPLSLGGRAHYNVANLAAAALAATALGVTPAAIATTFAEFGASAADNPGRSMRFDLGGVRVLLDYAHNPGSLNGLLEVARQLRGDGGRLGLLLGHAGNREDADYERIAATVASFGPDLVVVKETDGYLRGREPGEVPALIRAALRRRGLAEQSLPQRAGEVEAARCALEWARPGDVVALLVHSLPARAAVLEMLHGAGVRAAAEPRS